MSADELKRILVVEDDAVNRILMTSLLKDKYELVMAEDIQAGQEVLGETPVELVLLDLSLSQKEDGLELVKFIRGNDALASLPVIIVTAHVNKRSQDLAMEGGGDAFIPKPVDRTLLLETIASFI